MNGIININTLSQRRIQAQHIFAQLKSNHPHPTTELSYSSGFELLTAVILSAQATDVGVNKVTAKLFPIANSAQQIAKLGVAELTPYLSSIGLYHSKAKNLVAMATILTEKYHGEVPKTREELEALPGVGRKTANVILNTLYHQPVIAVDTHIFRLANRLGIATGKTVLQVEQRLLKVIAKEYLLNAHHWLILHGRYICKARNPNCANCKIRDYCDYYQNLNKP